jgi:hypothetical protein
MSIAPTLRARETGTRMPVLHYVHPLEMQPDDGTWCGRSAHDPSRVTTDHQRVTCRTCLAKVRNAIRVCILPRQSVQSP